MYPQRATEPEEERSRAALELWRPGPPAQDVTEDDDYVVVDDRAEGILTLVVSAWPSVDRMGRLVFPDFEGARRIVAVEEARFAEMAKPQSAIRAGDTFRARGTEGPVDGWRDVADITSQARAAAKAALYGAVAPRAEGLPPAEGTT
jgi:hypothetical protein